MLQCFISHCSDDLESIVMPLDNLLSKHFSKDKFRFFCSSTSSNPLMPGTNVGFELKRMINESVCMIAIVTDSYLRSPISLTELSSKWFIGNNKGIIPLVYSFEGEKYLSQDFISDIVFLKAIDPSRARFNAELMMNCLIENGFEPLNKSSFLDALIDFFKNYSQEPSKRPYIGSGEVYRNINSFCEQKGIKQISYGVVNSNVVKEKLSGRKEIILAMTTGSSFIDTYSKEFLQKQIANGTNIYMIIPNKNSDFCRDVAFIESNDNYLDNLERLTLEFVMVVRKLKFLIEEAKAIATDKTTIGHIFICAAYTLLRQTVCIGKNENGDCWGWITTTMPPSRAAGSTPTIVFEGNINYSESSLGKTVYKYVSEMIEVAHKRDGMIDLETNPDFISFESDEIIDIGERKEIEKEWKEKYRIASDYMKKRKHLEKYALIEIAAQHPLNGDQPGEEFKKRLDFGFRLFQELSKAGCIVKIYVPGSKHMFKGTIDTLSLSEAGQNYLRSLGLADDCIFGDKENIEYMGTNGVYNSCDECFVSASLFKDNGFGQLHCVCAPNQALRKQLFYLNFKVIPLIHTVPNQSMFHQFTDELFDSIPTVLYRYPNWSIPECPLFHKSRSERKPQ